MKHVDDLVDLCVADGVFRLDKALGQDTHPVLNAASTQAGTVTVEGFFFGDEPGSIAADGQALAIVSWSDTAIVAQLPDGFSPGEKLVDVTTASGRAGHQFFRIDTPPSLHRRLPLPGRTLSGDPGDYKLASSEFDESFYGANPRALVGLDGSLYYKFSFAGDHVTCTVLEEGSIIDEAGGAPDHLLSASADGSISSDQERYMVAGPTKSGIIASSTASTRATSATPSSSQPLPTTGDTATPPLALLLIGSVAVALGARSAQRREA